jgi:hypothetical protein
MQPAPIELALLLILRVQFELLRLVLLHQLGDRLHGRLVGDPFESAWRCSILPSSSMHLSHMAAPPAAPSSDTGSFRFRRREQSCDARERHPASSCGQDDSGYGGLAAWPDVGTTLSTRLADEAGFEIGEPDLICPLVDDVAAEDHVVAGVVQAEDDETTNAGRAHLAQRDLDGAAVRQVAVPASDEKGRTRPRLG